MHTSFSGGAGAVNPPLGCNPACTGRDALALSSALSRSRLRRLLGYTLAVMDAKPAPRRGARATEPGQPSASDRSSAPAPQRRTARQLIVYTRVEPADEATGPSRRERAPLQRAARRGGRLRDPPPGPHVPARPRALPAGPHPARADPQTEIPLPSFEIVVFDNRFPAFEAPEGAAEVVVYTDDHDGSFGALPAERAEALMWVWRHRYAELGAREDVDYVFIFENRGVEVGVTLHHPHGQIYGYPFVPPVAALELAADERLGGCAPCALIARERAAGTRVLFENDAVDRLRARGRALAV